MLSPSRARPLHHLPSQTRTSLLVELHNLPSRSTTTASGVSCSARRAFIRWQPFSTPFLSSRSPRSFPCSSTTHFVCNAFTVSSGTKTFFGTYLGYEISSNRSRRTDYCAIISSPPMFAISLRAHRMTLHLRLPSLLLRSCDDDDDDDDADRCLLLMVH